MQQDPSYLLDIAKLCQTILRLTADMTKTEFEQDERTHQNRLTVPSSFWH
ncbi:hypothetical protein [Leptodesmis sichuanensis]|nr:hypothetical protein [Leptodesmis sichuanensis]UIE36827.1 hypothetical protein KIK02_17630 [Leptodesmis sichuanensis A121]